MLTFCESTSEGVIRFIKLSRYLKFTGSSQSRCSICSEFFGNSAWICTTTMPAQNDWQICIKDGILNEKKKIAVFILFFFSRTPTLIFPISPFVEMQIPCWLILMATVGLLASKSWKTSFSFWGFIITFASIPRVSKSKSSIWNYPKTIKTRSIVHETSFGIKIKAAYHIWILSFYHALNYNTVFLQQ